MPDPVRNQELPRPPSADVLWREVQRLRASLGHERALFQAIFDHSPHGIIVCDADGRITLQNPAAARIWAGSAAAGTAGDWGRYRAFHPDRRAFTPGEWSLARCLKQRRVVSAEEVQVQRLDGTFGVLLGSSAPLLADDGELEGGVWVFADITPFKGAGERLRSITNALPALISFVGADGRYELCNDTYEQWFGLRPEQALGR